MEMCRGVSIVSPVSPSPDMDTSCDRCTCPHQTDCSPGDIERTSICSNRNKNFSSGWKNEFLCFDEGKLISKVQRRYLCSKWIIVFLVILLNLLIVGASPTHRVRHRQHRNVLLADRLCDSPGAIDQPTHDQCSTVASRVRRDVNHMSLREGQASSLCAYSVCVDEDSTRRPVHIHRVYCLQSGCRCTQEGAYRCTQLYNKVEVWHPSTNTTQTLDVEYGCVCAAKHGSSVDAFVPDTGDK